MQQRGKILFLWTVSMTYRETQVMLDKLFFKRVCIVRLNFIGLSLMTDFQLELIKSSSRRICIGKYNLFKLTCCVSSIVNCILFQRINHGIAVTVSSLLFWWCHFCQFQYERPKLFEFSVSEQNYFYTQLKLSLFYLSILERQPSKVFTQLSKS